ncbi:hypothetical protein IFM89_012828 [Coptis chinensis]|uniref:Cytochrome P450 n=1 Tax=Coptis chinensis TaxID=261450 RepID=A0A835LH35_9MAGN|nr:hypothetical protein IFM89_012828 [Coptis chinensis]
MDQLLDTYNMSWNWDRWGELFPESVCQKISEVPIKVNAEDEAAVKEERREARGAKKEMKDANLGFAPFGEYWRNLRRISATHLFSPRRIASFSSFRSEIGEKMIGEIKSIMRVSGEVEVKRVLHFGSLNNVMISVFGKRYDFGHEGFGDGFKLEELVSEGYELLGIFNWIDHFPVLGWFDFQGVRKRCKKLVSKVNVFVGKIIEEHRMRKVNGKLGDECVGDFVDVLLDLEMENSLSDSDMVVVLWEMIFRGTDTVAILLEWILARMVLHPDIQSKAQAEIGAFVGNNRLVSDSDLPNLPYLLAIVKESLRVHPPGLFLSWARLAIHDVYIGKNCIPAGTTAMVNMWAITHDENVWSEPNEFKPERFMDEDQFSMNSSDMTEVIYPKVVTLVLEKTYWMLYVLMLSLYVLRTKFIGLLHNLH